MSSLVYEGMTIDIIRYSDGRERVASIDVTGAAAKVNRPIFVGMKRADLFTVLGRPQSEKEGELSYCYDTGDIDGSACAEIRVRNDAIVGMSWHAYFD